jgi:hypothetical protein
MSRPPKPVRYEKKPMRKGKQRVRVWQQPDEALGDEA